MKHLLFITFTHLLFISPKVSAQTLQREVAITINDFYFESKKEISDLDYASKLVRFISSANDNDIPLHLFIDSARTNYIQQAISLYLESSSHKIGSLVEKRLLQLDSSDKFIPSTISFKSEIFNSEFLELDENEKQTQYIEEYVDLIVEDFLLQDSAINMAIGKPIKQIISFEMNDLNVSALPLFWKKLKELEYDFITMEEVFQDSTFQFFYNREQELDSLFSNSDTAFSLEDFYAKNEWLNWRTESLFASLTDEQIVGQMLVVAAGVLGKKDAIVERLVAEQKVGGIILLKGSIEDFTQRAKKLDSLAFLHQPFPLLYSADAEPSLVNMKIAGTPKVKRTNKHTDTVEVKATAQTITEELKKLNIYHNYAPVADMSPNNAAIGNRTFGNDAQTISVLCNAFIKQSQAMGVAATVKHFPGHGLVKGDSHYVLPFIDGELQEAPIYQSFIDSGVVSVMVGHIAVKNNERFNTNGLPASCSRVIVNDLLKEEMGFDGIVITDAMRMQGVLNVPEATLKAAKAGCDMLLMVESEDETVALILKEIKNDDSFKQQVYQSVKKIIKLKLCLGVIKSTPIFDIATAN